MERSILFFDIDGTILTEDGTRTIPDSTRRAIAGARAKGHLAFVNTGRVYLNIEPMIRELGFDGYVCGCGTNIYYQGRELLRNRIPKEICRETVTVTRACRMAVLYEAADMNGYDSAMMDNEKLAELMAYFSQDGRPMVDVGDERFYFDKFTAWYPLEQDISVFRDFLQGKFEYIDRGQADGYGMCEIVPQGFSKGTGIQYLLEYFRIPYENSYAFGDSTNDLSMLTGAAHSAAMGGSPEIVQNAVEFVTKSIYEDGLAYAMEYFHL
ncbi:MAG: HAD family hydrolase [Bacteroides sp.]|nr:HAD family hydrolase [Bacteroides sp.]MCM1550207.1 HAD family hydrolase [Clostridium sp.]